MDVNPIQEQIDRLKLLPYSERVDAIRQIESHGQSQAIDTLTAILESDFDGNTHRIAIKMLGRLGNRDTIPILLRHFDEHKQVVVKALLGLGVFDHVMPETPRERHMFRRSLQHAKPELKELIAKGNLSRDLLRQVLPPIM